MSTEHRQCTVLLRQKDQAEITITGNGESWGGGGRLGKEKDHRFVMVK